MNAWQWALELLLTVLLAATLFYAMRLERTIGVLRRDRMGLGDVLAAIRAALDDAERGIEALQTMAEQTCRALNQDIEQAGGAQEDMRYLLERLETVAARVEATIKSGRAITATDEQKPAATVHSKAERDLLKVLRLSR